MLVLPSHDGRAHDRGAHHYTEVDHHTTVTGVVDTENKQLLYGVDVEHFQPSDTAITIDN